MFLTLRAGEPLIAQVWKYDVNINQEEMLQVETNFRFQFKTLFYPIYCWNNDKIRGGVIHIVFTGGALSEKYVKQGGGGGLFFVNDFWKVLSTILVVWKIFLTYVKSTKYYFGRFWWYRNIFWNNSKVLCTILPIF